jgi:hypothetical protein
MASVAIDFDQTIADSAKPNVGYRMGPPMPGAIEAVKQLALRHSVIIFSARAATEDGRKSIEDWMHYFQVPYQRITAIKPKDTVVFVDDRGYRFVDWATTMRELPHVISENQRHLGERRKEPVDSGRDYESMRTF